MVTFVQDPPKTKKEIKEATLEEIQKTSEEFSKKSYLREIKLQPQWHGHIRDRMWLWFPLTVESGFGGKPRDLNFHTIYPKIIQWTDGKYYVFKGTHTAYPELGLKGDNTVHYAEILTDQGERIEVVTYQ